MTPGTVRYATLLTPVGKEDKCAITSLKSTQRSSSKKAPNPRSKPHSVPICCYNNGGGLSSNRRNKQPPY